MNERHKQIVDAATSLFLSDGVGVPTAKIAKVAGVSNGSLFNTFATKQALIDHIYTHAKRGMFAVLTQNGDAPFDRSNLYTNWKGYIDWARDNPNDRQVMHLLLEAGLVSEKATAEIDRVAGPHVAWLQAALDSGVIHGPNVSYIGQLILFQSDLVITENLHGEASDLAFDMLCKSIGLET